MERMLLKSLAQWRSRKDHKPLILHGARQVGKTWLLKEFGRRFYTNTAYINFEADKSVHSLFNSDLDIPRLLLGLRIAANAPIEGDSTLIVFDEVQECPRALAALKYFRETAPQYHIAAAGSLLGVAMHADTSFPVGNAEILDLRPLCFKEFLDAVGDGALSEALGTGDWSLVEALRPRYLERLKQYFIVGGMPEAVASFVSSGDMAAVRGIQKALLASYEQDFSKHAGSAIVPRIRSVWRSLPTHLAREQRKFVYGLVREGARAREYEGAIEWLRDSGLELKCRNVPKPGIPLRAYWEDGHFKLFMHDVGLLGALADLPQRIILDDTALFEEFKGALTEQYAHQELRVLWDGDASYWSNPGSRAEVDFLIQTESAVYPLEVKAGENLQSKSLKVFRDKFSPPLCLRTSLSPWRQEQWLVNIPLYALSRIPVVVEGRSC